MTERTYLLPLWIRLWHWTNAALILVLTMTGLSLHFAAPGLALVPFATAARIHEIAGIALVATYAFFAVANIVSGNWWQYVPKPPRVLARCWGQAKYYLFGVFRGDPPPHTPTREVNFNPLQALFYWMIMYLAMPVLLVSGLIFLFPQFAPDDVFGFDGLLPVAVVHYLSGAAIVLFMIIHVYLGSMGAKVGSHYKMMVTGWHEH